MSESSFQSVSPLQPVSPNEDPVLVETSTPKWKKVAADKRFMVAGIILLILLSLVFAVWAYNVTSSPSKESVLPSPTPEQTIHATDIPTMSPTIVPTPTVRPTATPTPKPTASPTVKPTATPFPTPTPSPTPSPTPQSKIITQGAGQDGYVSDFPAVYNTQEIIVGRTPTNTYRGFVGFDLAEIPATATITKATLRLYQYSLHGSPYTTLGTIQVDHLDFGTTLDTDDFNGGNLYQASFGTMGTAQTPEWKSLDVTAQVKKDRGIHTSSQFRLHFATEAHGGEANGELVTFSNPNASGTSDLPQLVVEYY